MEDKAMLDHVFLNYQKAVINFVFSFSWDVINDTFENIEKKLVEKHWKPLPLFKRPIWWVEENDQASYHPTIVTDNLRVLHYSGTIGDQISILVPINKNKGKEKLDKLKYEEFPTSIKYDFRLFENGTGICNFSIQCENSDNSKKSSLSFFDKIMSLQHLATSIASFTEKISGSDKELLEKKHLTRSYIKLTKQLKERFGIKKSKVFLAELFTRLSLSELDGIFGKNKDLIPSGISKKLKEEWQNPYVISILQVDKSSMERITSLQDKCTTKEIGAIAVRLTEDNSEDPREYLPKLRSEYIYKSLGFFIDPNKKGESKIWLRNYSHSSNLFYTFGRRAAIAVTSKFDMHPSYFAIPTFINVIELLRSRWHLGTVTNLKLDETFEKISHRKDINRLTGEIFDCRVLYGLFLQNPTPYLFDSGAITEISDSAESVFWLGEISNELEKKLLSIDKLVEVLYTKLTLKNLHS